VACNLTVERTKLRRNKEGSSGLTVALMRTSNTGGKREQALLQFSKLKIGDFGKKDARSAAKTFSKLPVIEPEMYQSRMRTKSLKEPAFLLKEGEGWSKGGGVETSCGTPRKGGKNKNRSGAARNASLCDGDGTSSAERNSIRNSGDGRCFETNPRTNAVV